MRRALSKFKEMTDKIMGTTSYSDDEFSEDYLYIDTERDKGERSKILIKPFNIAEFEDIKPALDALREGYTIALINIRILKDKDIVELKRAINKIKKTCDAIEGDIAGFGEDWIVVTPAFARVDRNKQTEEVKE